MSHYELDIILLCVIVVCIALTRISYHRYLVARAKIDRLSGKNSEEEVDDDANAGEKSANCSRVTIDAAHTIDPVKHGRWICHPDERKFALVCSECGQVMPFVPEYLPGEPPFCNCGAKMDGGESG